MALCEIARRAADALRAIAFWTFDLARLTLTRLPFTPGLDVYPVTFVGPLVAARS